MNGYSSGYGAAGGGFGFPKFLFFLFLVAYLVAWVFTMQLVTMAAKEKGYDNLGGKLWFIGFCGLIFTPPIIVAALPDKKAQSRLVDSTTAGNPQGSLEDELPEL